MINVNNQRWVGLSPPRSTPSGNWSEAEAGARFSDRRQRSSTRYGASNATTRFDTGRGTFRSPSRGVGLQPGRRTLPRRPRRGRRPVFTGPIPDTRVDGRIPGNARSTEYARWVQHALNTVLNARLPIDGVIGENTRAAIREFQNQQKLPVDGIMGPDTERALSDRVRRATTASQGEIGARPISFVPFDRELGTTQRRIDRSSGDYIRWLQRALNLVLGARLTVDGIFGPLTRSAVRSFQRQSGLLVDGTVGPQTEMVLIHAGAAGPPTSVTVRPSVPTAPDLTSGSTADLRNRIARLATQEWRRWSQGRTKESDPVMRSTLADYWQNGTGTHFNEPGWWSKYPWSAAFISWILRRAGTGNAFRYSPAHANYIIAAKQNRLRSNTNPVKAYRVAEVAPQVGDLVCQSRANSGATYDNIQPGMATHCDIVTAVRPGEIQTIGGNVSNSVTLRKVPTDGQGRIIRPGYFAVIQVGGQLK